MRTATLDAIKAAYVEMLREGSGEWRIMNQPFYCQVRDVIADVTGVPAEFVQSTMENFVALK